MLGGLTDEQIRTALDYVNDYKKEAMAYDASVGISPPTSEEVRAWETVETALRQMRTEPCVWCKWTDNGYRIEYNLIDEDGNCCPDMDNVVVTGIATYCPNCGRKLVK